MGLNLKDILLHLFKLVHVLAKSSYTFLQRHPLVSGALSVFFILYLFLSYIYSFLAYLSPFLVCAAIFVRIFWSSEKTELKYVKKKEGEEDKGEQKKVELDYQNIPNSESGDMLYKYPSQNATSRRKNFRGKKWDVYGGLEEKAKDLSAVFHNEFTKRNIENKEGKFYEKGECSLDYGLSGEKSKASGRHPLRSEPSMVDLVEMDTERIEDGDDEDEEDAQEDRNKAIEWNEDDQKNLMDLGFSEIERNRRLETLIARRRARKLMKGQVENNPTDKKSTNPSHIAPLFITRRDSLDSSIDFEGLEIPGSAPSVIPRSPYNIPFNLSEERPHLKRDSFDQEFIFNPKDMAFCRHESFSLGPNFPSSHKEDHGSRDNNFFLNNRRKYSDRLAYPRFRSLSDKGNHDWLIDQLLYAKGSDSGLQSNNAPKEGEKNTHEEDEKFKTDMKNEKVKNAHDTKSMSDHTTEPDLFPNISNEEKSRVSFHEPHHQRHLRFPTSTSIGTNEEHIPSPFDKKHDLFSCDRRMCHTPTYSIASDLQVEVSEVGSPASTVEEIHETNSTSDRDSVVYDGDIDRDISSGSEELWGASFHGREAQGVSQEDIAEGNNNSRSTTSPTSLGQIDEENVADVSSFSSRSDMPEDTPTYAANSEHNIFSYMKNSIGETEAPQPSKSLHVTSPQKGLMDNSVDNLPNETFSEKSEEWSIMSENFINEAEVINEANNSATTYQDNIENSSIVRQESVDEASTSSVASSPRSVLPEVLSPVNNQQVHIGVQQSNMDNVAQETSNDESLPDTVPQNIQPLMDDITDQAHTVDLNHSLEQINILENSIEESNYFGNMNDSEVNYKEEHDNATNKENREENFSHQIRQEAFVESIGLVEKNTLEDMDEKSRESVDDKVPSNSMMIESSSEVQREHEPQTSMRQETSINGEDFIDNNMNVEVQRENYSQSESKELVEDQKDKENLVNVSISMESPQPMATEATNSKSDEETSEKSYKVSNNADFENQLNENETMVAFESVEESHNASNATHMKEAREVVQLENGTVPKPDKPNDSSEAAYLTRDLIEMVEGNENIEKPASNNALADLLQPSVTDSIILRKETNEGLSEHS
ncbi:hypothetical protein RIF29_03662 [Crotalaria pallida]|uniref:Uncharacterized protein n=1 Tax=Crotalaria pallida TaxID=3830 RepID=A0AAN9J0X0_CROPI